ncbi:MAG TPA: 50S ribosomal protein L11 methyltransferase [Steroidobacteraceae bacterium]
MPFLAVSFELGALDADRAEQLCFDSGALAVTLSDTRDDAVLEPAPGEIRLWPATRLEALYPDTADEPTIISQLQRALPLPGEAIRTARIADRVWEREWLRDFHAMRFGERLWVCPHHERVDADDAVVVHLDPGLAFGTGTHASTALCLRWLDAHLEPGGTLIDYGCGSGILAIAAAKLGAGAVYAYDTDPQACLATRENAAANGVASRLTVCTQPTQLPPLTDMLIANILASTLCELAPQFAHRVRPGGALLLAGILTNQAAEVAAAHAAWFDIGSGGQQDDWLALAGVRRT